MARSHSLLVFLHYMHSYSTHSFITFVEFRSSFLIAVRSGRGPPLGCRAEVRTRGRLTAARCNMGNENAEFYADFESVEKVVIKLMLLTFITVCKSFRPISSFDWTFSSDSNSASNFGFYNTHIKFLQTILFCFYEHFLLTLKPNADETDEKKRKTYFINGS